MRARETSDLDIYMMTIYAADFDASPQPQPFPLQGSKRAQVPIINRLMPTGRPRLIEPFCGSAAVTIGARFFGLVSDVVISDTNESLIRLWRDIVKGPDSLVDRYSAVWAAQFENQGSLDSRGYFNIIRERYNNAEVGDTADFLFLLNRIVKAALRYSKSGKMNQSADPRRTGAKPATVRERVFSTSAVMEGAQMWCRDWLDAMDEASIDDVIYLDPPYQGTTDTRDQRYISGLSVDAFESGVRRAVERELSVIISYDALRGPVIYGRPLDPTLDLLALDVVTGVSAQGTLLGRKQESHETLYLSPALVARLGGPGGVYCRLHPRQAQQSELLLAT